jgi:hypothetical protein
MARFTTPLLDVIKGFAERSFYFLENEGRIVGLISIANLNCRQVGVYLFSLLSELEVEMGNLIAKDCDEWELVALTFGTGSKSKDDYARKRYVRDRAKGVDVPVVEYLHLSDIVNVIRKKRLFKKLGYESAKKYDVALGPLVKLRDKLAHPARSLLQDSQSGHKLWDQLDRIEKILAHLRSDSPRAHARTASGQS